MKDDVSLGNCWAFAGKTATITIQLSKVIQPVAFSLEHSLSSESKIATPNAPKLFRVYLIQDKMKETGKSVEWIAGTFYYQMESGRRQLFPIRIRDLPYIDKIRLEILDNYGGSYTCVYHFGVHGHEQQNISQA